MKSRDLCSLCTAISLRQGWDTCASADINPRCSLNKKSRSPLIHRTVYLVHLAPLAGSPREIKAVFKAATRIIARDFFFFLILLLFFRVDSVFLLYGYYCAGVHERTHNVSLLYPDRPFHNLRASKSVDCRFRAT